MNDAKSVKIYRKKLKNSSSCKFRMLIVLEQGNIHLMRAQQKNMPADFYDYQKIESQKMNYKHRCLMQWAKNNNMRQFTKTTIHIMPEDINIVDKVGNSVLYYACKHGNNKMVKYLLGKGAQVNLLCSKGDSPMHMAFRSGSK